MEPVIAVGQPARAVSRPWPVGRLNHGLPGSRVKARAPNQFTPLSKSELRDAWVTFLSPVPFQWFATLTFETNVHPEEAFKKWRRFTNDLNREIYGRHWTKRPNAGVHWVVAVERQNVAWFICTQCLATTGISICWPGDSPGWTDGTPSRAMRELNRSKVMKLQSDT
jgi:hypothetical protein